MASCKNVKNNIHLFLIRPCHAGNIGSSARAMKNMGFRNLVLVNPVNYNVPETNMMAWNSHDIIKNARVFSSIKESLAGYNFVIGTTRRTGKGRENLYPLEEIAGEIASIAVNNKVAILFGPENTGLLNTDLEQCHKLAFIDTDSLFPSLNLAQAVLIVCYEIHKIIRKAEPKSSLKPAKKEHIDFMYAHIDDTLKLLGYGVKGNRPLRKQILKRIHAVFSRSLLERKDVQMIRGLCQQIDKKLSEARYDHEKNY